MLKLVTLPPDEKMKNPVINNSFFMACVILSYVSVSDCADCFRGFIQAYKTELGISTGYGCKVRTLYSHISSHLSFSKADDKNKVSNQERTVYINKSVE